MKLISNHLLLLENFRQMKDVIVRINIAHVKSKKELIKFISIDRDVMIDYPLKRKKPPIPVLTLEEVFPIIKNKKNVKYFAISNVESPLEIIKLKDNLDEGTRIVPKIETIKGVINLREIVEFGRVEEIMLDSEDLYTDTKNNNKVYLDLISEVKRICKEEDIKLLELYGVVFSDG